MDMGVPLSGLPQFPEPFIAKLVGKANTYSSPVMQQRLVAAWTKLRAETQNWWQTLSPALVDHEAELIGHLISQFDVKMGEVLPQSIAVWFPVFSRKASCPADPEWGGGAWGCV